MVARCCAVLGLLFAFVSNAQAQSFDPSWYRATPSAKIAVAADGVYRVTGAQLQALGFPLGPVSQLELVSNGRQVPFLRLGIGGATLAATDTIVFVGRRNRGTEEQAWAYLSPEYQSSDYFSLYTDTSYYWLRGGATSSLQYNALPGAATLPTAQISLPDTVHYEIDRQYLAGTTDLSTGAGNPMYTQAEGSYIGFLNRAGVFTSDFADSATYAIQTPYLDAASTDSVRMWVKLVGGTGSRHRTSLRLGTGSVDLGVVDWTGYEYRTLYGSSTHAEAINTRNQIQVNIRNIYYYNGVSFSTSSLLNRVYFDYIQVAYPRLLRPTGGQDDFWQNTAGAINLSLSGYTGATRALALMPETGTFADLTVSSGNATLAGTLPSASSVWTSTRAALKAPAGVTLYGQPALASLAGADYVIVTTAMFQAQAEAIAAYHRTHDGVTTQIVLQDDILQQFDGGRPTPVALRRFIQAAGAWSQPAKYVLLLGDALLASRNRPIEPWEVLTFGNAASDAWLAMSSVSGAGRIEQVSLGRLPVRTAERADAFLAKLQAYDATPDGMWQKRAMYVAGGPYSNDRPILQSGQRSWASTAASAPSVMDTTLFFRTNPSPPPPPGGAFTNDGSFRTRITDKLREGVAWYSYYGHSSPTILEMNTDYPPEMENAPRLPVFISLGCRTGAFTNGTATLDTRSFAEDLVISDIDGAIAHWGSSELSQTGPSSALSNYLTQIVFRDTVRVLGDVFRLTKQRFAEASSYPLGDRQLLQYFLIGDPLTRVRIETQPNFAATGASIYVGKDTPVITDGTLSVTTRVYNYGFAVYGASAPADSVTVQLDVTVPGQAAQSFRQRVRLLDSLDVPFIVPLLGAGEHTLRVTLDPESAFAESSETDNTAERRVTVFGKGLAIAYPQRYGITSTTPTLRVTPLAPSGTSVPVVFELDTTAAFTSPFKRTYRTSGTTVAPWTVSPALTAGTSYYWRARVDEAGQENVWTDGTFTVDPAAGMGMMVQASQRVQLRADSLALAGGQWRFAEQRMDVQVNAMGSNQGTITAASQSFHTFMGGWGLVVLNGQNGQIKASIAGFTFTPSSYQTRYGALPAETRRTFDSVAAILQDGDVVLLRQRPGLTETGNPNGIIAVEDQNRIRALGSVMIDNLSYKDAFWMVHKVGDPSVHYERIVPTTGSDNDFTYTATLYFPGRDGSIFSPVAGPSRRWTSARADVTLPAGTTATLAILDAAGTVLRSGMPVNDTVDLSEFDARQIPSLRFRVDLADPNVVGTPQLTRLYVRYDPVPDIAVDAAAGAVAVRTDEGLPLTVNLPVMNLGETTMDVVLRYFIVTAANTERLARTDTLRAVAGGETRTTTAQLPTDGLAGTNTLRVVASPLDFSDPVATNNVLVRTFVVSPDQAPPTFVVRIDGEEVPNDPRPVTNLRDPSYPFVSARPSVEVVVRDPGAVRLLTDPSIAVLTVDGKRVDLTAPGVTFTPATAQSQEAKIVFSPDFSRSDSTHTITLRVFDASGNEATNGLYQAHVRVSTETALERVLPYPNPMVDRTTFAFRLRGADATAISDLRVRVFTLGGRLVKEFDLVRDPALLRTGTVRIGWNMFAWDGKDADGDPLAPGVYLYRISAQADGVPLRVEDGHEVERLVVVR
ncbi:MAG: C25 family cysteine peptidase [Bacteroidetes bacterium]|nr:C25 family cysteine peptidase [Bacteroidota bacterium]